LRSTSTCVFIDTLICDTAPFASPERIVVATLLAALTTLASAATSLSIGVSIPFVVCCRPEIYSLLYLESLDTLYRSISAPSCAGTYTLEPLCCIVRRFLRWRVYTFLSRWPETSPFSSTADSAPVGALPCRPLQWSERARQAWTFQQERGVNKLPRERRGENPDRVHSDF
jgi:hypothetical protein